MGIGYATESVSGMVDIDTTEGDAVDNRFEIHGGTFVVPPGTNKLENLIFHGVEIVIHNDVTLVRCSIDGRTSIVIAR